MPAFKEIMGKREINTARLEQEAPDIYNGFNNLAKLYFKPGALDRKQKVLMAIAAAVATRCIPCLAHHSDEAISMGATRDEILEASAVGIEFGGGPSYCIVRDQLLEFLGERGK